MLTSVWTDEVVDDRRVDGYHLALNPFPAPSILAATSLHMQRSRFFPKPAEIIELLAERSLPAVSTGEAWETVNREIRRHGYGGFDHCEFGDDAISAAVKSVGWRRICLDDNSQGYIRRDFDVALETAQQRIRRDVQGGNLDAIPAGQIFALPRVS